MSISRETFDPSKNYKAVTFHQDRDLLDSELNELQKIIRGERKKLMDVIFNDGAIVEGLEVSQEGASLHVSPGIVYFRGHLESVSGAKLDFDPGKTSGIDFVWLELLIYPYGYNFDASLINPATGEPTAEREKWVISLKAEDTSLSTLPGTAIERHTFPIYQFERSTNALSPTVLEKSNLKLDDFLGTLPGNRIRVSSITENQLSFAASEGLGSLLENMAERTYDQAGSYLTSGLDTFMDTPESDSVPAITNAGRAYVQGYRLNRPLPTTTLIPKSIATKSVRGEQKTFAPDQTRYGLNSRPLKATTQVEAIIEKVANFTRGSVGGGEDLITPNPVVNILEVSQGATSFQQGVDWQQSGNHVDWLGTGNEPGIGTTYTVRWTYTKQLEKGIDYVDGGWFGQPDHPGSGSYSYVVTPFNGQGENPFDPQTVVTRETKPGDINHLAWADINGASGYRVYRAVGENPDRDAFKLLSEVGQGTIQFMDDGVAVLQAKNPEVGNPVLPTWVNPTLSLGNLSVINFGRASLGDRPIPGSNCSVDYDYFLGRTDVLYATREDIKRLEGAPADFPKMPVVPEGTLGLCAIDCPPNATNMLVHNFGLTRVSMEQIHQVIQDVEDLKYNDAQSQMNNQLQNRDSQSKKGIYSDDFSNVAQSDIHHEAWSARVNGLFQFVAPEREEVPNLLQVDQAASTALFKSSLALLPATEKVLVSQLDWSETKNINPYSVFEQPDASLDVTPNIGRRGQTGVSVVGVNFTPGATCVVKCDGKIVTSNFVVDSAGRAQSTFLIPLSATEGDRIVEMTDGTRRAETRIRINKPQTITRIQRVVVQQNVVRIVRVPIWRVLWRWRWRTVRRDPLAQTFSFTRNRVVSAVGLFFTEKDADTPVTVQIRGVTTGLPNDVVLAETVIAPSEINTEGETKVGFSDPIYAEANTSYAVVLLTNSTNYRVKIATLGQSGQHGVITSQAYNTGVLLESSNAETWTPLNASDLTCKIYGYDFNASGTVQFEPITGVDFTELNIDEYSAVPEGTEITWEYSTDNGQSWDAVVPAEEEDLQGIATQVLVRAHLVGTTNDTPALNFRDVNLVGYLNKTTGTYITRENQLTQSVATTKMYVQMDIPSGTSVAWFASNDGGQTWENAVLEGTRKIDFQWTEYTFVCAFSDPNNTRVRYKAEMQGSKQVYPRIHSFGATLS